MASKAQSLSHAKWLCKYQGKIALMMFDKHANLESLPAALGLMGPAQTAPWRGGS